jgi:predicted O-methyltransferase YrrM
MGSSSVEDVSSERSFGVTSVVRNGMEEIGNSMVQTKINRVGAYELTSPVVHNQSLTEVLPGGGVAIWVPGSAWAYAAAFSLNWHPSADEPAINDFLLVRIAVGEVRGEVSLCVLSREMGEVLVHRELTAADANGAIEFLAGPIAACGDLVIRNASPVGAAGLIEMHAAEAFAVDPSKDGLHYELRSPIIHNHCRVESLSSGGVAVSVPERAWSYAAAFSLHRGTFAKNPEQGDYLCMRVTLGEVRGEVGVCVLSRETNEVLAHRELTAADANGVVEFLAGPVAACGDLVIRNASPNGVGGRIELQSVETLSIDPTAPQPSKKATDWSNVAAKVCLTTLVHRHWPRIAKDNAISDDFPQPSTPVFVRVVDLEQLGACLGYSAPVKAAAFNKHKDYLDWRMEDDDSHILAYLYRNHQPRQHLEFGTWEGFGAVLCAQNCDAEIWTLNLPEGERTGEGGPVYSRTVTVGDELPEGLAISNEASVVQTDAGEWIGWRYRAAGYGQRVRQILVDSTKWDSSSFADGSFDSILIDGGHATDVVVSDTTKSLRLLRPGGLLLWHDFCPADGPMIHSAATRGVVNALHAHWHEWSPNFDLLFWIRPSYLLLGRKFGAKA